MGVQSLGNYKSKVLSIQLKLHEKKHSNKIITVFKSNLRAEVVAQWLSELVVLVKDPCSLRWSNTSFCPRIFCTHIVHRHKYRQNTWACKTMFKFLKNSIFTFSYLPLLSTTIHYTAVTHLTQRVRWLMVKCLIKLLDVHIFIYINKLGLKYICKYACVLFKLRNNLSEVCTFFSNFLLQLSSTMGNNLHALFYVLLVFYKLLFFHVTVMKINHPFCLNLLAASWYS